MVTHTKTPTLIYQFELLIEVDIKKLFSFPWLDDFKWKLNLLNLLAFNCSAPNRPMSITIFQYNTALKMEIFHTVSVKFLLWFEKSF